MKLFFLIFSVISFLFSLGGRAHAEDLAAQHSIKCKGSSQSCPEGLAKLVVTDNSGEWKCTGFLVSDKILVTNRHCLPDSLVSAEAQDCSKSIRFFFAATRNMGSETLECNKVLSFSSPPNSTNVATLDYAFLELAKPSKRKAFTISHAGVRSGEKITFWRIDGLVESTIQKDECDTVYQSLLFPFTNASHSPVATFEHCAAEHGHSGSPLLNTKGEVVAILEGMNNEKNVRFFEEKFGAKKIKNIIKASNFSCISGPQETRQLPSTCSENKAENEFLIEGNKILESSAAKILRKGSKESKGVRLSEAILYDPEYTPLALRSNRLFLASSPTCIAFKDTLTNKSEILGKTPDQKYSRALNLGDTQICRIKFEFSPEMKVSSASRSDCKKAKASLLFSIPEKSNADVPYYFVVQDEKGDLLASVDGKLSICE